MASYNTEQNGPVTTETTTTSGTQQITSPTPAKQEVHFIDDTQTSQNRQVPKFKRWDTAKLKVVTKEKEEEDNLTDYTYVYDTDTTQPDNTQLNEMNEIDYEQDKTEWTKPPQNEQARHNRMQFTLCYDDDCWAHRQAKEGANYFPQQPRKRQPRKTPHGRKPHSTTWQKCYNDQCTTHLQDKRETGIFPRRNGKNREVRPQGTEDLKRGGEKPETEEERDRRINEAIDAEEIIALHTKKGELEDEIEELKEKLEEEERKFKKEEKEKEEMEKALEEMRKAWKWEYSMKKVVGQDVEVLRKAIAAERREHAEKEEKLRTGGVALGVEVLRMRNLADILCQRIAAGEFSGA